MKKYDKRRVDRGFSLLLSISLVFIFLGMIVFSVFRKISVEMLESATQNLSESLNLIQCTIEAILNNEAEFQKLLAQEIALVEDPEEQIRSYGRNQVMAKISLVWEGERQGISNTGEVFTEEGLNFTTGRTVNGLDVSQTYLNYMGAWAYTMKCPVVKDDRKIADIYVEYTYDSLNDSLPNGFYDKKAMLYIMDAETERFVLKPRGMGERNAGHLNLDDFYRANDIKDEGLLENVSECLKNGKNIMFYHKIRNENALNYMWSVNDGTIYLIGYVPVEAIQQEGRAVNHNIFIVVAVMLIAFFSCCVLYYFSQRQQNRLRKEREAEREIYNKQLAEALQAAQIASNSKTMFLSNMSHDIRTPMNAVLGFTTLLARDAENPDKVREYTKKIMASGQHLLSLINDVLDVSKIESGKVVLSVEEFTLNDLISSVDAIIRPMAKEKGQIFNVEVTGVKHEYLLGDETRVNQVLINLLSNAVKYTQAGGNIWLRIIGLKQRSSQFEHIRIEVEDNGYGMTPEYLVTIFDAFTRAENSTTNKVQGTGLGMAITKNIVDMMNGTINVKSEQGVGTEFSVSFTFRLYSGKKQPQIIRELQDCRALVVDDDFNTCDSVSYMLGQIGMHAEWTLSGKEAVLRTHQAVMRGNDYRVYIVDWLLPDMNGVEVARRIKKETGGKVPIIVLTAYDWSDIEEEAREAGVTAFCSKPLFMSELSNCLNSLISTEKETKKEEEKPNKLRSGRILLAEDVDLNQEIASTLLNEAGFCTEIAENGQIAFEMLKKSEPGYYQLILMDIQMPVMNGYEATKAIRSLENKELASIPIIAMTANAFEEDKQEALKCGMNSHISKPIDIKKLFDTLDKILD